MVNFFFFFFFWEGGGGGGGGASLVLFAHNVHWLHFALPRGHYNCNELLILL